MAAINLTPSPGKQAMGIGFWQDLKAQLALVVATLSDTTNGTSANTIAELQTFCDTVTNTLKT